MTHLKKGSLFYSNFTWRKNVVSSLGRGRTFYRPRERRFSVEEFPYSVREWTFVEQPEIGKKEKGRYYFMKPIAQVIRNKKRSAQQVPSLEREGSFGGVDAVLLVEGRELLRIVGIGGSELWRQLRPVTGCYAYKEDSLQSDHC
ncbi:hypothetical protein TNCV_731391 [Trichonephila clavipes]|nr:hypothetical protein TNCV_731391 [Trichonephila clavipes]